MNQKLHSLNFSGMGKCSGGNFDKVNISGTGKVQGNIKCNEFEASGVAKVLGNLESDRVDIAGVCKIQGNIKSKKMSVSGTLKCYEDIVSHELNIGGMINIGKHAKIGKLSGEGVLNIGLDSEFESININGMIECMELLNCENLEIDLQGTSTIKEIGASYIKVYGKDSNTFKHIMKVLMPSKYKKNKLESDVIEGDDIDIELCQAKIVRGKNVKIGPKCDIDTVEYSETLEIDELARVKFINKI